MEADDEPPVTPERAALMARIRTAHTKPEQVVRRWLHAQGFRFRLHSKKLPGTPDLILPRHRLAVFVHGCFWHNHPGCPRATLPKTRRDFWKKKLDRNATRDREAEQALVSLGWRVVIVWECETRQEHTLRRSFRPYLPLPKPESLSSTR
jgi:DNA mismatch endonuclease, patch repair protein